MDQNQHNPTLATPKWEGKVSANLATTKADQIWGLFKDFFNLHKWFPTLSTSYGVHGSNGAPGCIRYCAGSSFAAADKPGKSHVAASWSKERLVAVDEEERSLSYEIVESNIGFNGYRSTVRISPMRGDGCVIEWFFTVEPVKGLKLEDLVMKYEVGLQRMALKMESALRNPPTN